MRYVLLIDCKDEKGLINKITAVLLKHGANIEKNDEFVDKENSKFFMRTELFGNVTFEIVNELKVELPKGANIKLNPYQKKDIVLFVTKESHCLGDILIKHYSGELHANIKAVVSNYDYLEDLVQKFSIPYFTVLASDLSRVEHEEQIVSILNGINFDYIVLAKYMRILSPSFVQNFENRIINIHHSFLPAFIGANPYKQAYERGVKIIGATAHFVNDNLDEGPIIAQSIIPIDHSFGWRDMQKAGKDIEKSVLSKGLDLVFEDRVFVYANKTVIF